MFINFQLHSNHIMKINILLIFLALLMEGCGNQSGSESGNTNSTINELAGTEPTQGYNALRNPYFGETHLHTGWSFDEAIYNVQLGPENRFADQRSSRNALERSLGGRAIIHCAHDGWNGQFEISLLFLVPCKCTSSDVVKNVVTCGCYISGP